MSAVEPIALDDGYEAAHQVMAAEAAYTVEAWTMVRGLAAMMLARVQAGTHPLDPATSALVKDYFTHLDGRLGTPKTTRNRWND